VIVFQDLTPLRESEERYQRVFRQAGIGIGVYGPDLRVESFNDIAAQYLGITAGDAVGKDLEDLFGAEAAKEYRKRLKKCLSTGSSSVYEDRVVLPQSTRWFLSTYSCLLDAKGAPSGVQVISEDITAQKEAERHYRDLVEDLPEIILETDLDAQITFSNAAGMQVFGYSMNEIEAGVSAFDLIAPDDRERARANLARRMQGGDVGAVKYTAVRKDGSTLPILLSVRVVKSAGKPAALRGIVVDLTEQELAEQQLAQLADELRRAHARLASLQEEERRRVSRELHDRVSQGLTALSLSLSSVESACSKRERLDEARQQLNAAKTLCDDLGDEVRNLTFNLRPPVLDDFGLLEALRWHAARLLEANQFEVSVEGSEPSPRLPRTQEIALFRIAQEALANILKHSGTKAARVALVTGDETVTLQIIDSGAGFDLDDHSRKTGLGLVSMRERAQAFGAELEVESTPTEGTTVSVLVPR